MECCETCGRPFEIAYTSPFQTKPKLSTEALQAVDDLVEVYKSSHEKLRSLRQVKTQVAVVNAFRLKPKE